MRGFDFSGWVTKNDLRCSDGRIIRENAFEHNDGNVVPLVWNHQHNDAANVLGQVLLENRPEGVYGYGSFNDSPSAENAKAAVIHGDVTSMSIYANQLKQRGSEVLHGSIREVSLVLAGANPGASIENIYLAHSDEFVEDEAIIWSGEEIYHSDEDYDDEEYDEEYDEEGEEDMANVSIGEVLDTLDEDQAEAVAALLDAAVNDALESVEDDEYEDEEDDEYEYDDEEDDEYDDEEDEYEDEEGDYEDMKHNVFENDYEDDTLMHSDFQDVVIGDAQRCGSIKESFLAHADAYGIENIDWLQPEYKNINGDGAPGFITRQPDAWVDTVMNGVHHSPFSKIKMMFADLREDEARAKGYIKGKLKKEEVFGLLKRTVSPTTIYKKQKLDRDDVIDITDFNVVSWLKGEMRIMLDEEIARAIVFGDGRAAMSEDKINESNIIPIWKDADLYTIKKTVTPAADESLGHAIIVNTVKAQDEYEGSGNLTCFIRASHVSDMLLLEDKQGHRMYKDMRDLALAMGVDRIVKVPASIVPDEVYSIIVDLRDYNVGADKGGAINMFDDFDIDYNQMKYLIETRCSGALVKPYSAIVLKKANAAG